MGFSGELLFKEKIEKIKEFNKEKYIDEYFCLERDLNIKFYKDSLFFIHGNKLFLLEGVILNNHELKKIYNLNSWKETFIKLYEEKNLKFLSELRGRFHGIIYDFENKKLTLFTDQLKSKNIYYCLKENSFLFTTNISELASLEKENNILDEDAAYLLLTFGGTLEERTLFKNIKKLNFATLLEIDLLKRIEKKQYWMFNNTEERTLKKENIINEIDRLFRQAIRREYEKDIEYGYSHLVPLSAGRDSRMNTWVAHELGYNKNVLNMTFSETEEDDEKVPKKIAEDLKHEWIFKSLNNGNCCYDLEEISIDICGEVHFGTLCPGNSIIKNLNFKNFGILHTGQVGDLCYYGSNKKKISKENLIKCSYIYSKKLLHKVIEKEIIKNFYANEEIFNYVNRGIHVTCESSLLYKEIEVISPFLDIDFLEFCLKIPDRTEYWSKIYDSWILSKYPKAAKYKRNGRKIGEHSIRIFGKNIVISQVVPKILKLLMNSNKENIGMNPFDKWYNINKELRDKFDQYFRENIDKLANNVELKNDCENLYVNGTAREKAQVLGLLATLKLYFK